ncbi:MAG: hypothetical protein Q8O56_04045 [Solirubrobacteraceae bacterium]|nr:hypothetical protein [Solirubrobacteraceae bacterium]
MVLFGDLEPAAVLPAAEVAVEVRRRTDQLLARLSRRDDHGALLANGHVRAALREIAAKAAALRHETPLSFAWARSS